MTPPIRGATRSRRRLSAGRTLYADDNSDATSRRQRESKAHARATEQPDQGQGRAKHDEMKVEAFIDLICPRCYLALHYLNDALAMFEHSAEVQIVYRGFQLEPARGRSFHETLVEDVMRNHRMSRPEALDVAADVQERLRATAAREGLNYRPETAGPVDTFDAHRMVQLAAVHGLGDLAVRRLQEAYFAEGIGIADPESLDILVAGLGIDFEESRSVAFGDAYREAVLEDHARAAALGIATVPFFLFGERSALSGVHSPRWLLEMLRHAWALWWP